jgi:hypothetical protein
MIVFPTVLTMINLGIPFHTLHHFFFSLQWESVKCCLIGDKSLDDPKDNIEKSLILYTLHQNIQVFFQI